MISPMKSIILAKVAIIVSYFISIFAILEIIFTGSTIFSVFIGVIDVIYLWNIKNSGGEKIFSVARMEKKCLIYYFPLHLADEVVR
jgi:hypothetical protein